MKRRRKGRRRAIHAARCQMRADGYHGLGATSERLPQPSDAPIALLILISMILPVAMNMHIPAMAEMRHDLATTPGAMQATLYAFLIATAVGQVVIGPLSDLYGRRTILLAGLWIFAAGSLICIFAPNVEILILGRIIQGLGGCTGLALSRAIIRDIHGVATSASMLGYVSMGMATAPLVAPAIGGFLYEVSSWRAIFVAIGALGAVALIATTFRLRETRHTVVVGGGGGVFKRWRAEMAELLSVRDFWAYALTLGALCVAFFAFVGGGAFVAASVYGLSASEYGLYFIFMVSGYVFGNFITGRYSTRFGIVAMIVAGNAISLVGVLIAIALVLAPVPHPLALFGPMVIIGIGNGFALPNCMAGCVSVRPHLAGTAAGLAGASQVGSGAMASAVVGFLMNAGIWADKTWSMLLPMLAGAIAAFVLSFTLSTKRFA